MLFHDLLITGLFQMGRVKGMRPVAGARGRVSTARLTSTKVGMPSWSRKRWSRLQRSPVAFEEEIEKKTDGHGAECARDDHPGSGRGFGLSASDVDGCVACTMNAGATVLSLLSLLVSFLTQPILMLWDRAPWHRGKPIKQLLAAHPRLEIIYLPTAAPDLRAVFTRVINKALQS